MSYCDIYKDDLANHYSEDEDDYYSKYDNSSFRKQAMRVIEDLYMGEGFKHFKNKFVTTKDSYLDDEDLKKLYTSRDFMKIVIDKLVSFCPELSVVDTRTDKQKKLSDKWIRSNQWTSLIDELYANFEKKGDNFLQIYFKNNEDKIPKVKVLDPKNMKYIILDKNENPKAYIYREFKRKRVINYIDGTVSYVGGRYITKIFEKGRTILIDDDKRDKTFKTVNGEIIKITSIVKNRPSYENEFALICMSGKKNQSDLFTIPPAYFYIDDVLTLDKITTNIHTVNSQLGFPIKYLIDGTIVAGKLLPGSHFICKSDRVDVNSNTAITGSDFKQMAVKDIQITNDIKTIFTEYEDVKDSVYEKTGLIMPSLERMLGSTDSSRVIQQLRINSENKIEFYVDEIILKMGIIFEILFKENEAWTTKDDFISFIKPSFIFKVSPFDETMLDTMLLNNKTETRQSINKKNGDSNEEILQKENRLKQEDGDVNESKEAQRIVKSANNIKEE